MFSDISLDYFMFLPDHWIKAWKKPIRPPLFPQPPYLIFYALDQVQKTMLKMRWGWWKAKWMVQESLLSVSHLKCWLQIYRMWMEGMLWKVKGKIFTEKGTVREHSCRKLRCFDGLEIPVSKILYFTLDAVIASNASGWVSVTDVNI